MNISLPQIQENLSELLRSAKIDRSIIFEVLKIYSLSSYTVSRLKRNPLSIKDQEYAKKDIIYIKFIENNENIFEVISRLKAQDSTKKYNPKFLVVINDEDIAAMNLRDNNPATNTLHCKIQDLATHAEFFFELTGRKIDRITQEESEADRRAAEKMNKLYEEIEKDNIDEISKGGSKIRHDLNVFFSRLLFCLFAEDTGIFSSKSFQNSIELYTEKNGEGVQEFFENLFAALDIKREREREDSQLRKPYNDFPYVNGSIFNTKKHNIFIPKFSADSRNILLELANSNWGEINPDIFGTIFQGVVDASTRDERGMDYTSVPNIMKVIKPLFLDELNQKYEEIIESDILPKTKIARLYDLWNRISKIKIFDPACGSGNFLIITYKKLRELENNIIHSINEYSISGIGVKLTSQIKLENFYGIEIDDFAHELAVLSLYIAAHQMNVEFEKEFGKKLSIIPLKDNPKIVCANAARIDWQEVCPNLPSKQQTDSQQFNMFGFEEKKEEPNDTEWDEIYLIGNPPYKGSRKQSEQQKQDMKEVAGKLKNYKSLDYISIWFIKSSIYISNNPCARICFVSTNSITQGEQVSILWDSILKDKEIFFAYKSFKWKNSAKDNAGVTVIIVSIQNIQNNIKSIFMENEIIKTDKISPYLTPGSQTIVSRKSINISNNPKIDYGSFALDGGFLTLSENEYYEIIQKYPDADKFIKLFFGSQELIQGKLKYCIWIENENTEEALNNPEIKRRVDSVRKWRLSRTGKDSQKNASTPWKFAWNNYKNSSAILFPIVSSENREYIPIGYLENNVVISNAALAIYDAPLWLFALLESKMHMAWIRTVCGQLETRIRYSSTLGYNTFPVPPLSPEVKKALEKSAEEILFARENHTEKTLAQMYDPSKMPSDLRTAHQENDMLVDKIYSKNGFENDEQRLTKLFELYEQMTSKEKK